MTQICIIAGNYQEALAWAKSQYLQPGDWFFPVDKNDLLKRVNFHVLVVGSAGQNVPASYFEDIYQTALSQGRKGRW